MKILTYIINFRFVALCAALSLSAWSVAGHAAEKGMTFQGVLKTSVGVVVTDPNVTFTGRILAPVVGGDCVLFAETYSVKDLSVTNGYFQLVIGQGTRSGSDGDKGLSFKAVFNNLGSVLSGLSCIDSNNSSLATTDYTPSANDGRKFRLKARLSTNEEIVVDFNLRSSAFAVSADNAEMLNGKVSSEFVNTTVNITQSKAESLFGSYWSKLVALLTTNIDGSGTYTGNISGNASTATTAVTATNVSGTVGISNGGTGATTQSGAANAVLPSQATNSGKYLTTDGTNVSWATVSGGGAVSSVAGRTGAVTLTSSDLSDFATATDARLGVEKLLNGSGKYFKYKPNNAACANNEVLKYDTSLDSGTGGWKCATDDSGSGSGTVSSGTAGQLAYYSAGGTTVSGLTSANDGVLVTNNSGVPSIGGTLPSVVQSNITQVGTVTSGVWQGTSVGVGYGGTGATNASGARSNLGAAGSGANSDITSMTSVTSVASSGSLALNAGGTNQNVVVTPSGTGSTILNGNVGIGTASPAWAVHVQGADVSSKVFVGNSDSSAARTPGVTLQNYMGVAASGKPILNLENARGTLGSGQALQSGDVTGIVQFQGHNGSSFVASSQIIGYANETWTGSSNASSMAFNTTSAGSTSPSERVRIDSTGRVGIGSNAPNSTLQIGSQGAQSSNYGVYVGSYNSGAGQAQYVGNWAGSGHWGIGPYSSASDNTIRIGRTSDQTGTWNGTQNLNLLLGGNLGVGSSAPISKFNVSAEPSASANFGMVSLGVGPFDGASAGYYTGHASGTGLAMNFASGFGGDLTNLQVAGVSKFKIDSAGNITFAGAANSLSGANSFVGNYSTTAGNITTTSGNVSAGSLVLNGTAGTSTLGAASATTAAVSGDLVVDTNTLMVDATNNRVGIGTAAPARVLDIYAATGTTSPMAIRTSDYVAGSTGSALFFDFGASSGNTYSSISASSAGGSAANNLILQPSGGNVGVGTATPNRPLAVFGLPVVSGDNRSVGSFRDSSSLAIGTGGGVDFGGVYTSGGLQSEWAGIKSLKATAVDGEYGGHLAFMTRQNGSPTAERVRILDNGNVGIGTATPARALHVVGSNNSNSSGTGLVSTDLTITPTAANTNDIWGVVNYVNYNSNFNTTRVIGSHTISRNNGTGTMNETIGGVFTGSNGSSGVITTAKGVYGRADNLGTGTISSAQGLYGLVINTGGGTITNGYGVYIDNIQATNKWSLYAMDSTAPSYFAGSIGIGITTPSSLTKLDVNGMSRSLASVEGAAADTNSSTAYSIPDVSKSVRRITLTGNTTITLPDIAGVPADAAFILTVKVKQDATGNRTLAFAADTGESIKWDGGSQPAVATAATKESIYQFFIIGGETVWYASQVWSE